MYRKMVRQVKYLKFFGRRKNFFLLLSFLFLMLYVCSWLSTAPNVRLDQIESIDQHYHMNKTFGDYVDKVQLLIEPVTAPCAKFEEIPLITLVSSSPARFEYRQSIRDTWAKYQHAYFVLGLYGDEQEKQLIDFRKEAKLFDDLIVYDFYDHPKNSTLKTALMMHWSQQNCPKADFFMKTADNVMVNPWTLGSALTSNCDAQLLGYVYRKKVVFSDEYNKWYYYMFNVDLVPQYLSGSAYLIRGKYLPKLLNKAYEAPLINLEDIYFTYIIAYRGLGLTLRHDWRFSPKKPLFYLNCAYWTMLTTHDYSPDGMLSAWSRINTDYHAPCSPLLTFFFKNEWLLI